MRRGSCYIEYNFILERVGTSNIMTKGPLASLLPYFYCTAIYCKFPSISSGLTEARKQFFVGSMVSFHLNECNDLAEAARVCACVVGDYGQME